VPPLCSIDEFDESTVRMKLINFDQQEHQCVSWQATALVAH
jgi:hypothetical protein